MNDTELEKYARAAGRFDDDVALGAAVIGELMLRGWLYGKFIAPDLIPVPLIQPLTEAMPLRDVARPNFAPFRSLQLADADRAIWDFFEERARAFLQCDGIIPVVIKGEAIPIPFNIDSRLTSGIIEDSSPTPVAARAWIQKADQLWKALGRAPGVRLNCVIDESPEGEPDGGSFAIPILIALSQRALSAFRPLNIVATGAIVADAIEDVDGKTEKAALAKRMGALFFAPAVNDAPDSGVYRLLPGGVAESLRGVWETLIDTGKATCRRTLIPSVIEKTCGILKGDFGVSRRVDFAAFIAERTQALFGREDQLREVLNWIEAGAGKGIVAWITGQPGAGKTAFMCQLAQDLAPNPRIVSIAHFFGAPDGRTAISFVDRAIDLLQAEFNLDIRDCFKEIDPTSRLLKVINKAVRKTENEAESKRSIVFLLDGVDELGRSAEDFAAVVNFVLQCRSAGVICICAALSEGLLRQVAAAPEINTFWPHGRLPPLERRDLERWLDWEFTGTHADPEALDRLVTRSSGLPLWLRHVINAIKHGEITFEEVEKLPAEIESYYQHLLDRWVAGAPERSLLRKMLFLLAWAEEPVSKALFDFLLQNEAYTRLPKWESLLARAFELGQSLLILEETTTISTGTSGWRLYHEGLYRFLRNKPDPDSELMQLRWLDLCQAWRNAPTEDVRKYALLYYANHLARGEPSNLYELAEDQEFFAAQRETLSGAIEAQRRPTELALARAIAENDALAIIKFTLLTAQRVEAQRIETMGGESPLHHLRRNETREAIERSELFPSAGDRVLWRLVFAAERLASEDRDGARQFVEDVVRAKVSVALDDTQANAAAVLLVALAPAGIASWRQIGFRLRKSTAQLLLSSHLAARGRINEAIEVRNTIRKDCLADANEAQREIVKATAKIRPAEFVERGREMLRQDESQYYWAAIDVIESVLEHNNFPAAYDLLDSIPEKLFWQRVRAFSLLAVAYARNGNSRGASREIRRAEALLPTRDSQRRRQRFQPAIDPKYRHMIPMARGQVGMAIVECDFGITGVREAKAAFALAMKEAQELKGLQRIRASGRIAQNYVEATLLNRSFYRDALHAVSRFQAHVAEAKTDSSEKDTAWGNVAKLWAKLEQKAEVEQALSNTRSRRNQTIAAIAASYFKNGQQSMATSFLLRVPRVDRLIVGVGISRRMIAGDDPLEVRNLIATCLMQRVGSPTTARWGVPRVLSEIAASVIRNGEREPGLRILERAMSLLQDFKAKSGEVAFGLTNLGSAAAYAREQDLARSAFSDALAVAMRARNINALGELGVAQVKAGLPEGAKKTFDSADLILQMQPDPKFYAMDTAQLCQFRAKAGFQEQAIATCESLNEVAGKIRTIDNPERRSGTLAEMAGELAQGALYDKRLLTPAADWARESREIWENSKSSAKLAFGVSGRVFRVEALIKAVAGDMDGAVSDCLRIRSDHRGRGLRDLAIYCIKTEQAEKALEIASLIDIAADRMIPDVVDEFAERGDLVNIKRLLPMAACYPAAAFRMAAVLIRLGQPDRAEITPVLDLVTAVLDPTG